MPKTVLILGGTADARRLAERLVERFPDNLRVITSLAGRTSSPRMPKGEVREGGFGGSDGLADYLRSEHVDLLVDATHPFAAQISAHAATACTIAAVSRLSLIRPAWSAGVADRWIHVPDIAAAAEMLTSRDGPCLITTGINELAAFKEVSHPELIVRLIEQPRAPLPIDNTEIVIGNPPYRLEDEKALFERLKITTIVTKNAGGNATRAKIDAAAALGIEVIMIDRPPTPTGDTVTDEQAAAGAVASLLSL